MIYIALIYNEPHELENPKRSQLLPLVSPWQANGWRGSDGLTFSPLTPSLPPYTSHDIGQPTESRLAARREGTLAPSPAVPIGSPLAASFPLSPLLAFLLARSLWPLFPLFPPACLPLSPPFPSVGHDSPEEQDMQRGRLQQEDSGRGTRGGIRMR